MYDRTDVSENIRSANNNFYCDEKYIKVKFNSDDDLTWIAWRNNNCQVYFQWLQEILSVNFLRYIFVQISMVQYKCGVW